jgi:hypothetical protein
VCKSLESHTVPQVRSHAVCERLESHTVPQVRSHAVCKRLELHTVPLARIVLISSCHSGLDPESKIANTRS